MLIEAHHFENFNVFDIQSPPTRKKLIIIQFGVVGVKSSQG
jgi:hypothetical protein